MLLKANRDNFGLKLPIANILFFYVFAKYTASGKIASKQRPRWKVILVGLQHEGLHATLKPTETQNGVSCICCPCMKSALTVIWEVILLYLKTIFKITPNLFLSWFYVPVHFKVVVFPAARRRQISLQPTGASGDESNLENLNFTKVTIRMGTQSLSQKNGLTFWSTLTTFISLAPRCNRQLQAVAACCTCSAPNTHS